MSAGTPGAAERAGAGANTTIALLGDVMLGRTVAERLADAPPAAVWSDEVGELCSACDAVLLNLECCISERGTPTRRVPGKPFFFRAPPAAALEALAAIGTSAVSLANNHALDYEETALADTLAHLNSGGIVAAGAGADAAHARRGAVVTASGLRIGLLAMTDHPASYGATDDGPGVAFADLRAGLPGWIPAELRRLRAQADLVVAFPHWGPNMTVEPARWQHDRARDLVAAGADVVAGHSAHVFHGAGSAGGRPVLYDLGDALDDYAVDDSLRNDLGILALWRPGSKPELELVGLELRFCETQLARGGAADWIARRLEHASAALGTEIERVGEQRFLARPGVIDPRRSRR